MSPCLWPKRSIFTLCPQAKAGDATLVPQHRFFVPQRRVPRVPVRLEEIWFICEERSSTLWLRASDKQSRPCT